MSCPYLEESLPKVGINGPASFHRHMAKLFYFRLVSRIMYWCTLVQTQTHSQSFLVHTILLRSEHIPKSSCNLIEYEFSQLMACIFSVPFNFPRIFQKLDRYYCPLLYDRIRSYQYAVCKIILLLIIVYYHDSSKNCI